MKKVTAFVGSARKKNTYNAVVQLLDYLEAQGDVETEIVRLSDYQLGICRGCQQCCNHGEELCPLKDDRDVLFDKIQASDGVIFATPNYAWHMSGMMKVFLDRFGAALHRPRYFGKAFTCIVTQAMGRGEKIVEYFDFTARVLGFNTLKGITLTGFNPWTEKQQQKNDRVLVEQSKRFYALLKKPAYPAPTLVQLMIFRIARTMMNRKAPQTSIDYRYFTDKGWFESDYYYPARIGALKRAAGRLVDTMVVKLDL